MPSYPYFYELKGQALLEGGHPAEAIAPLRHAVETAPNPALIQITLAQALIATNNAKTADEAVPLLRAAIAKEPESGDAYEQLAMAYGRKGNLAMPTLPRRRRPSRAATTRLPANSPRALRRVSRSARRAGSEPTISSHSTRT